MPKKQNILKGILLKRFNPGNINRLPVMRIEDIKYAGIYTEVFNTYKLLGGTELEIPINFGKWDIVLEDFIVEFDEEQHFNRYRRITLNSLIYSVAPHFNFHSYLKFCDIYEEECLIKASRGGYWTSPSTERQFGNTGPKGELTGNGSPRWKQRAFYDYLRDVYSVIFNIPVVRLSIYDKLVIKGITATIDELLISSNKWPEAIINLIQNNKSGL